MDRIEEIRERLSKATPGPWKWNTDRDRLFALNERGVTKFVVIDCEEDEMIGATMDVTDVDAALIANAPTDIAYLLDLIEPWVPVETLPEEEGVWQVWNAEGYQDGWFQDGRFEYVGSGFAIDPPPTHYRRIKGPSHTLIKEDPNGA